VDRNPLKCLVVPIYSQEAPVVASNYFDHISASRLVFSQCIVWQTGRELGSGFQDDKLGLKEKTALSAVCRTRGFSIKSAGNLEPIPTSVNSSQAKSKHPFCQENHYVIKRLQLRALPFQFFNLTTWKPDPFPFLENARQRRIIRAGSLARAGVFD
jgi:hypothetical protein